MVYCLESKGKDLELGGAPFAKKKKESRTVSDPKYWFAL